MNRLSRAGLLLFASLMLLSACDTSDPEPVNQEELITTVRLMFTPMGGGTPVIATWQDLDGDGGNPPTVSSIALEKNQTYTLSLELLNESVSPIDDITQEIKNEGDKHQFFFRTTGLTGMQIVYNDKDADQHPIGLSNTVTIPNGSATGTLTVILRHQPDKSATGVANGDITNAGGETDIETTPPFSVTIQ